MRIVSHGPDTREAEGFLRGLGQEVFAAARSGMREWTLRAHRKAIALLSGSGGAAPGSYPVPVRTGHTRRSEDYILPGTSKHGIQAGPLEGMLVNTAVHASAIAKGTHTMKSHGPRPFHDDAIEGTQDDAFSGMLVDLSRRVPH